MCGHQHPQLQGGLITCTAVVLFRPAIRSLRQGHQATFLLHSSKCPYYRGVPPRLASLTSRLQCPFPCSCSSQSPLFYFTRLSLTIPGVLPSEILYCLSFRGWFIMVSLKSSFLLATHLSCSPLSFETACHCAAPAGLKSTL